MKLVPTVVTRAIGRTVLKTKKNAPHIYFAGGIIGVAGSTVLACRATLKLEPALDEIKVDVGSVKSAKSQMNEQRYNRELAFAYLRGTKSIGVLYGPSLLLGAVSITALTSSHVQLSRRNATLTALYTGAVQAFDEYRARVREAIGEERENDIYLDAVKKTVDEDGEKKKISTTDKLPSQFARFFEKGTSANWKNDPEYNRYFLQGQQNYANDRLHAYGHVTLNDIYDWLGFERTSIGQLVGWVIGEGNHGYISFGLDDHLNVRSKDAVGWSCLLDFNVDGIIYDKI